MQKRMHPRRKAPRPIHVMFCFVDHFEPGWKDADLKTERERVDHWVENYPLLVSNVFDADGYHPRHTWFYPPHYFREEHILKLLSLCEKGLGEIEMHLHHSRMEPFPDSSETLKFKILQTIELYSRYDIFRTSVCGQSALRYAFIHGDWALDNSREKYCGVNDEITILRETGCYADFTFPSYMMKSQPKMVNVIYYANDDPNKPKSYDTGNVLRAGEKQNGDLMIIQGPLGLRWKDRKMWIIPSVDDGEISANNPPSKVRVDFWVSTGIHIEGHEDWVFVKVFTHGAPRREQSVLLGESVREMHRYLMEKYNDGSRYQLHYVTAREMFNIIKAAEAGLGGNPCQYRDFVIKPYAYSNCPR